jgi:hypothetical protein
MKTRRLDAPLLLGLQKFSGSYVASFTPRRFSASSFSGQLCFFATNRPSDVLQNKQRTNLFNAFMAGLPEK